MQAQAVEIEEPEIPSISLSSEQAQAIELITKWRNTGGKPHFYLGGLAGTGKSTLVRFILESCGMGARKRILVMAPTNKAADVLRTKGISDACTVHSVLYSPVSPFLARLQELRTMIADPEAPAGDKKQHEKELGDLLKEADSPKFMKNGKEFMEEFDLLICDEFSMVGNSMYLDLIEKGVKLLCVGDPAQLPPVLSSPVKFKPDFVLTQIHRQAQDNPIIRMAHAIRNGDFLNYGDYGLGNRIIDRSGYDKQMLFDHTQILTYTNDTRRMLNHAVRTRSGFETPYPLVGEKLICLRNNYAEKLWNGALYKSTVAAEKHAFKPLVVGGIHTGVREIEELAMYSVTFESYHRKVPPSERMTYDELRGQGINDFDYGYCITTHKSQGSEWDSVLVVDESHIMRDEEERRSWLYTAVTRASKLLTIYRP